MPVIRGLVDYSIKIGGEAGQGVQTVGELLSQVLAQSGYHVFTHQDYESRVRGGHNFYQIRVSPERVISFTERVDIVVAMDEASIQLHRGELRLGGILAYDSESLKLKIEGDDALDIPFKRLSVEAGGSAVMANTVAVGAVLGMLGIEIAGLVKILDERFHKKGDEVVKVNIAAAESGYKHAKQHCKACRFVPRPPDAPAMALVNCSEAAAVGALASGLKFYSAYPMTPSTGVMNNIAARAVQMGAVVEQAEDEIAAINMAIGASYAGVRAATGSSGGGYALMVEGLSLAGMTETPLVIFEVQRPGPATGLPTRTEQADLLFLAYSGHGEFPRMIFAPGSPRQAVYLTNKAFEMAEKYQIPAFVVFDQHMADCQWTYGGIDTAKLAYTDRRLRADALARLEKYKRHAYTESGVSPLAVPGVSRHLVVTDSDEHDEAGHIIEDAETRIRMVHKRLMRKMDAVKSEMAQPMLYGNCDPETVLVGWGSSYGAIKEAVDALIEDGRNAAMMFFCEVFPLPPDDYLAILRKAKRTVIIEGNATGQLATLIKSETGFDFDSFISSFDGRPIGPDYILGKL